MKLKFFGLALGLILFVTGAAVAQQHGGGQRTPPTTEQRLKRLQDNVFSKLDLKDDQQDKLNKVFTEFYDKQAALRSSGERPSRDDMKKLNDDKEAKVKDILTADQYKKYQDIQEQQMQQMKQRAENRRGNGGDNAPQQQ